MSKKKILIFIDWFSPAYKAGGPIVATVNFVNNMKGSYELYVFTSNKDLGDESILQGIVSDTWIEKEKNVKVFYASAHSSGFAGIKAQLARIEPDYIYINSIYSKRFSFFPLLIKRFQALKSKVIVAPRGMLKQSAVNHKRFKKVVFLKAFQLLQLHKDVVFQGTDETERNDVQFYFGKQNKVYLIPDFVSFEATYSGHLEKVSGQIRIIFVGRIHPIKNLLFLLDCLSAIKGKVTLTITGSIEDDNYWKVCTVKIQGMPENIIIDMKNEVPHEMLSSILLSHHIFILPTKGENFGHAIFEALTLGKPVIISDQTPWRNLYPEKSGWDISLNSPDKFTLAIEEAIDWDQATYNVWSENAWRLAKNFVEQTNALSNYKKLFS